MTHSVLLAPQAEVEIEQAYLWVRKHWAQDSSGWYFEMQTAIRSLAEFPERCALAPESADLQVELRQLLFGKGRSQYRIIFRVVGQTVNVVHFRHASRLHLNKQKLKQLLD